MKKTLLFIASLYFSVLLAGNENHPIGGRATGMGNTGLTSTDVWAVRYNQAGLAGVKLVSAGVSYESRFLLKETGIQSFAFALPTKSGTFGLNYTGFGNANFRESKIGLAYGMKFSDKLSGGIRINYHQLNLGVNYGAISSLTVEAGIIAKITEKLSLGAHVFNPTNTKLTDYQNETIPVILNLGLNYVFSDKVFANIEIEKDIDHNPSLKFGFEYHPIDMLYIRAGIATNPSLPSIGFGLQFNQFKFDFSSSFHPVLGATPAFAIVYQVNKKTK